MVTKELEELVVTIYENVEVLHESLKRQNELNKSFQQRILILESHVRQLENKT